MKSRFIQPGPSIDVFQIADQQLLNITNERLNQTSNVWYSRRPSFTSHTRDPCPICKLDPLPPHSIMHKTAFSFPKHRGARPIATKI
jgi:hypothetical protein